MYVSEDAHHRSLSRISVNVNIIADAGDCSKHHNNGNPSSGHRLGLANLLSNFIPITWPVRSSFTRGWRISAGHHRLIG